MWSLKKERLSRGFIVSVILVLVAAGVCRLVFFDDWRPVKRNRFRTGTEAEAWYFAQNYIARTCGVRSHSAKYDEAGKAWVFEGDSGEYSRLRGNYPQFTCRVYFGEDEKWHVESLWVGWARYW